MLDIHTPWGKLKTVKEYVELLGNLSLTRMFEIEPGIHKLFHFADKENIRSNPKFASHAHAIVDMLDCVKHILGPDLEPLKDKMRCLGRHHKGYGVPSFCRSWKKLSCIPWRKSFMTDSRMMSTTHGTLYPFSHQQDG